MTIVHHTMSKPHGPTHYPVHRHFCNRTVTVALALTAALIVYLTSEHMISRELPHGGIDVAPDYLRKGPMEPRTRQRPSFVFPTTPHDGDAIEESLLSSPPDSLSVPALKEVVFGKTIFIVSHDMSPTGAPRVACELATILQAAGAHVTVAVPVEGLNWFDGAVLDAPAQMKRLQEQARFIVPALPFKLSAGTDYAVLAKADLVIANTVHPRMVGWISNFRAHAATAQYGALLWYIHESQSVMSEFESIHTDRAIAAMTSGVVDGLMFVSWNAQQWWMRLARDRGLFRFPTVTRVLHWGLPAWRMARIAKAVADGDAQKKTRAGLKIGDSDFVFTILASFNPLKGHRGIIAAFRRAQQQCGPPSPRKWHFVAAGFGSESFTASDMAWVHAQPNVHIIGPVPDPERLLAVTDVYVSNSQSGGESWGLSTLEALAAGNVLLATGVGGTLEQVQDGISALLHQSRGGAHEVEDELQLARNMCAVFTRPDLASSMSARGNALAVGKFGQASVEADVALHLSALLQRGTKGRPRPVTTAIGPWVLTHKLPSHCAQMGLGGSVAVRVGDVPMVSAYSGGGGGSVDEPGGSEGAAAAADQPALCFLLPPSGAGSGAWTIGETPLTASFPFDSGTGIHIGAGGSSSGRIGVVVGGLLTGQADGIARDAPHALSRVWLLPRLGAPAAAAASGGKGNTAPDATAAAATSRIALPPLPRRRRRPLVIVRPGGESSSADTPSGSLFTVHVIGGAAEDGALVQQSHFSITFNVDAVMEAAAAGGRELVPAPPASSPSSNTDGVSPPPSTPLSLALAHASSLSWSELPPLPIPATDAAGVAAGGYVYVLGGQRGCARPLCSSYLGTVQHPFFGEVPYAAPSVYGAAFRYVTATRVWERLLDLPVPVAEASAAWSPSRSSVFVVGGRVDATQWLGVVQEWSSASREWTVKEAASVFHGPTASWVSGTTLFGASAEDGQVYKSSIA